MDDELFADGIDGVHGLRRRERTRLWFRALPPADFIPDHLRAAIEHAHHLTVTAPDLVDAVRVKALPIELEGTSDLLLDEWSDDGFDAVGGDASPAERQTRILRRLGMQHNIVPADEVPVASDPGPIEHIALTDWRVVQRNAPTLLLASSKLLDGRKPGPILGPGCEYRVVYAAEGVVGLEVRCADGDAAVGYCNAVDLTCIEPMVASLAGASWKHSTKERLRKITRGLSSVTGSLVGLSS